VEPWLRSALDYIADWLEFQVEGSEQPGCIIAVVHRGKVVAEHAFGQANLDNRRKADGTPPLSHRLAFQGLHGCRPDETA